MPRESRTAKAWVVRFLRETGILTRGWAMPVRIYSGKKYDLILPMS